MPAKRVLQALLLGFVAATLVVLVIKNAARPAGLPDGGRGLGAAAEKQMPHQVIVFYFHDNNHCEPCDRVERFSREAVESFPDALRDGLLEWREVNRVDPGNEHYVRLFQLVTQTIVVASFRDGRMAAFQILDDVLNRQENHEAFVSYVQEPIRDYLGNRIEK